MWIYEHNRNCNCCGMLVESKYKDIPIEEIKPSSHTVPCVCGYFFVREHNAVYFNKWQVAKAVLESKINNLSLDLNIEEEMLKQDPGTLKYEVKILKIKKQRSLLIEELNELALNPVPNHLWKDK